MARGWESKSVESQQQDKAAARKGKQPVLTAPQRERKERRQSLSLSRQRIANDIANSRSESHRQSLQAALDHLDEEIRKLDEDGAA
jgi:hypothetical protein